MISLRSGVKLGLMKNLYSPSMLKSYLSCKYIIFNDINEKKLNLKKLNYLKMIN